MKLIGLLSWFDEPVEDLRRAIGSFASCGMTHLVAVDGAYGLFPGAAAASPQDQHQAIREACQVAQVQLHIHTPADPWETETAKRAAMFAIAQLHTWPTTDDWFVIIDADEHVQTPVDLPARLADVTEDAAETLFHEPAGAGEPRRMFMLRMLFRCLPGLTVKWNHHTFVAGDTVLWGAAQCQAADLRDVVIVHTTNLRPARRRAIKRTYYDTRDQAKIEQPAGCWKCGGPATLQIRSDYRYDRAKDELHSNLYHTCARHLARLEYENDMALRVILDQFERAQPLPDRDLAAGRLAVHMRTHAEMKARA